MAQAIGSGTYGVVYRVPGTGVVYKVFKHKEGYFREQANQDKLPSCPNILAGIFCNRKRRLYMPLVDPVDSVPTKRLFEDLLKAVDRLQRYDLVHGDIKCANAGWNGMCVVLLDFGSLTDADSKEAVEDLCTSYTRPPEKAVHKNSDVWSVAITVIEHALGGWGNIRKYYRQKGDEYHLRSPEDLEKMIAATGERVPEILPALRAALTRDPDQRPPASHVLNMIPSDRPRRTALRTAVRSYRK